MRTLHHPSFMDVSVEVGDDGVQDWAEQGWRKTPLSDSSGAATAADKPGDNKEGKS